MSKYIISALRQHDELRGSLLLAAQELAHRADGFNGLVTISYSYLAKKCHQSRRTAIRHIHRLLDLGIIRCQRFWGPNNKWLCNRYQFVIQWEKPKPTHTSNGDILNPKFPKREEDKEKGKYGRVGDGIKAKEKILGWLDAKSKLFETIQAVQA